MWTARTTARSRRGYREVIDGAVEKRRGLVRVKAEKWKKVRRWVRCGPWWACRIVGCRQGVRCRAGRYLYASDHQVGPSWGDWRQRPFRHTRGRPVLGGLSAFTGWLPLHLAAAV